MVLSLNIRSRTTVAFAWVLLTWVAGGVCQGGEVLTWEKINAEIQRKFPHVGSLTVEALKRRLANQEPLILIDARTETEYRVSHIQHAVHLTDPKAIFETYGNGRLPVMVYCSVGYRSAKLADQLTRAGMKNVFNLKGSIFEWGNKGNPVYNQAGITPYVHPYDEKWGILLNQDLHRYKP
jgi:rhodanese-related sulfurtransferase